MNRFSTDRTDRILSSTHISVYYHFPCVWDAFIVCYCCTSLSMCFSHNSFSLLRGYILTMFRIHGFFILSIISSSCFLLNFLVLFIVLLIVTFLLSLLIRFLCRFLLACFAIPCSVCLRALVAVKFVEL